MYKKIISVMSVMLVVFLCFNYDVKADEVIDSSRRYNWLSTTQHYGNVDVTGNLFCLSDNPAMQSVNLSSAEYVGGGTTQSVVSTWESVYLWKFQATYVLKNTGDTYETFDNGRLYSQFSVTAKASTSSSGTGSLTDDVVPSGWYIDNIQGATLTNALSDGTMYWSVDNTYYGNTLVIAPGQTITFSYDINIFWWEQSFGVGGTTFACQNGSISNTIGYTQQDGYNSYSVYEFITDYPFPSVDQYIAANIDSIWTNVQTLVSQGVLEQSTLDNLLLLLSSYSNSIVYPSISSSGRTYGYGLRNNYNILTYASYYFSGPYIVESDLEYSFNDSNSSYIICVPEIIDLSITNNNDQNVQLDNVLNFTISRNINATNGTYLSANVDIISDYFILDNVLFTKNNDYIYYKGINGVSLQIPSGSTYHAKIIVNRYFAFNDISSISISYANPTFTFSEYTYSLNPSQYDSTNQIEQNVHSQEQSWFTQGNQSIGSTGIDNYQFNAEQSGGISGVSDDFVRVWNACGSLNSVWIFSLTLSLALYIIHHVPKQRS